MNNIRFVPTALHGIVDFVGGLGLIASPLIFGFAGLGGVAVDLPFALGIALIAYSLVTDYEPGIVGLRLVSMPVHLLLDFVTSAFLAAAPFMFGYTDLSLNVWLPQVIAGIVVMLLVLVTQTRSQAAETATTVNATA